MDFDFKNISALLNPSPIYTGIGSGSSILAGTVFFMFLIVAMIRYFQEATASVTGTDNWGRAFTDLISSYTLLLTYALSGGLFLVLVSTLNEYFFQFGSFSIVAKKFGEIMMLAKQGQENAKDNFVAYMMDFAAFGGVPSSWLYYKVTSILFALTHMILRIGYAIYFVIVFLIGFIIIPTKGLAGVMNLSSGWTKNALGLAIWPIVEALFFLLVFLLLMGVDDKIVDASSAGGFSGFTILHWSMGSLFILMIIGEFASLLFAMRIISNAEMISGIGLPAGMLVSKVAGMLKSQATNFAKGLGPSAGGSRIRDKTINKLSSFNQKPVDSTKKAIGSLVNKFKKGK